jgi:outer membrane protein assembly factor BamB
MIFLSSTFRVGTCPVRPCGPGRFLLRLLLAASCTVAVLDAGAEDWYRWRGPDLNGISQETGWSSNWPASGPKQLWRAQVGIGFTSITVADGRAYTMGNRKDRDTVYCFDAATGQEIWQHTYACKLDPKYYEGGPGGTPTVDGNRVYTLSKFGHLFCFEADTGKVIWSRQLVDDLGVKVPTWGFATSVLVEGDRLFLNVGAQGTALDKATGQVLWKSGTSESGYATPVPFTMGNQKALAIFAARSLVAVDPANGKELWSHPWRTSHDVNAADPIVQDDLIFISSGYNRGAALLRVESGKPKVVWENRNMRNQHNNSVLLDGTLYGFDGDSNSELKAVDFKTGQVKWSHRSLGKGSLMAADGKLIILSERGELVIADADPGAFRPLTRAQVLGGRCWTQPVLSHGRIYCRNAAGDLVCVDVSGR